MPPVFFEPNVGVEVLEWQVQPGLSRPNFRFKQLTGIMVSLNPVLCRSPDISRGEYMLQVL